MIGDELLLVPVCVACLAVLSDDEGVDKRRVRRAFDGLEERGQERGYPRPRRSQSVAVAQSPMRGAVLRRDDGTSTDWTGKTPRSRSPTMTMEPWPARMRPLSAAPVEETVLLTAQQITAKEAAHQTFDAPESLEWRQKSDEVAIRHYCPPPDEVPRFTPGIRGIGISGDILRIYVLKEHALDIEIPNEIEGLRTERVSTTGFRSETYARQAAHTPFRCGVSIGHHRRNCGTLGCIVRIVDVPFVLSNSHVLTHPNAADIDDDVMQPGPYDGRPANPSRRVAGVSDYEPLVFGPGGINHIDAAIAVLDDPTSALPEIMTLGAPANPPVPAAVNQLVAKHGRTTGLTFGTVVDISFDGMVDVDGRPAYFENQIAIVGSDGPFSESGDSGSLILDNPGPTRSACSSPATTTHTLANPIQAVLNRFGATIVTA